MNCSECDPYGQAESEERLQALLEAQALLRYIFSHSSLSNEEFSRLKRTLGKKYDQ